jgi:predicted lipid-binding transport protein (Tim44 family)
LLPFFVLLRIRAGWILAYFLADLAVAIGWLSWQYQLQIGGPSGVYGGLAAQLVMIGVWGRAALLVGLIMAFLAARPAVTLPRPTAADTTGPAAADTTGPAAAGTVARRHRRPPRPPSQAAGSPIWTRPGLDGEAELAPVGKGAHPRPVRTPI